MSTPRTLARRLATGDAVVIGLGSMIGAGVFSAWAPAAGAAGGALLIGLLLAAGVAYCNAVASAQLAARYPTSGGTYVYGREQLGPAWGFVAGWGFVIGKTASSAAMSLTFAGYLIPEPGLPRRLLAVAAVATLTAVNYRGISRTAGVTRVLVALSVTALLAFIGTVWLSGHAEPAHLAETAASNGPYGVLQSAGLLFFAFAGYARIATLGEEVREPSHTIPRAIPLALGITFVIYLAVGSAALAAAGADELALSTRPLATAAEAVSAVWTLPIIQAGAALASLGALLALIAGVGRTALAMARNADLPRWLSAVHARFRVPHHAELALGVAVAALALTTDLRGAIGFSSFGVLVYYAIANASAFTQPAEQRRWPRALNVIGFAGCVALMVTLPLQAVLAGIVMFAIGLVGWLVARRAQATGTA